MTKKAALKKVARVMKKVVGPMMHAAKHAPPPVDPGKTVEQLAKEELRDAGTAAYNAQSMLFESMLQQHADSDVEPVQEEAESKAPSEEQMVELLRENGEIAQEESERLFKESLRG